jgi:hypothetical protein
MEKNQFKALNASIILCTLLAGSCLANAVSPYAGQEARDIKALSQNDIQSYLDGKGMGLAKAAELNGYPGPSHVLALADALFLTVEQKEQTSALFKSMETKAIAVGRSLIEKEKQLDLAFAEKSITPASLEKLLQQIAVLQSQLRQVHLEAHLEQFTILKPAQIAAYNKLRGYDKSDGAAQHTGHGH